MTMFTLKNKLKYPIIAGPCSIESYDLLYDIAKSVKKSGATHLRGGAFKPRTNPRTFQGLGKQALMWLFEIGKELNIPTVSEILDTRDIDLFLEYTDIIQVGSRNMHNTALLQEVGKYDKPVLLKRGSSATYEEFLYASEYIKSKGNDQIILCERGIRTFSNSSTTVRNTLDISTIPLMKELTSYPIIVDPSHACGRSDLVTPLALASKAAGADGLMIEVHSNPDKALSDGFQSLNLNQFHNLCQNLRTHPQK